MNAKLTSHLQGARHCSESFSHSNSLNPHKDNHPVLLLFPSEMENLHQATSCNFWAGKHDHEHGGSMIITSLRGGEVRQKQGDSKRAQERDTCYLSKYSVPGRPQIMHVIHIISFILCLSQ